MKRVAAILTVMVAGCSTTTGLRDNTPFLSAHTSKAQAEVAGCVALAWGGTWGFHVRTEPAADRTSVILSGSSVAGIDMVTDISPSGSVAMFKRKAAWGKLDDQLAEKVRACI